MRECKRQGCRLILLTAEKMPTGRAKAWITRTTFPTNFRLPTSCRPCRVSDKRSSSYRYSCRNALIGSTRAARRAGTYAANIATRKLVSLEWQ
jgi:hypothetical protein